MQDALANGTVAEAHRYDFSKKMPRPKSGHGILKNRLLAIVSDCINQTARPTHSNNLFLLRISADYPFLAVASQWHYEGRSQ